MGVYSVRGVAGSTTSNNVGVLAAVWNTGSVHPIRLLEFGMFGSSVAPVANNPFRFAQLLTRGTAGSTITPTIENAWERDIAPQSPGLVLDLAGYTVNPTFVTGPEQLESGVIGGAVAPPAGCGLIEAFPDGYVINPGTGLSFVFSWAASQVWFVNSEVFVVWEEHS